MNWRISYIEGISVTDYSCASKAVIDEGVVLPEKLIKAEKRIELRDNLGQKVLLNRGAEFKLKNGPLGLKPEYSGELVVLNKNRNCGKYRTSCWLVPVPAEETADILMRPSNEVNTDEFLVFNGCIAIIEFNEQNKAYGICFVKQGEKVILKYNPAEKNEKRYTVVSKLPISNFEYDYYLKEYLDARKWK